MRFLAEGIEAPLRTFYAVIELARECRIRFPKECGQSMQMAMKNEGRDLDARLLDLGSLHAAARASARVPAFRSTTDARRQMSLLLTQLDTQSREYDRAIYARLQAIYGACGRDPGDTGMLISILNVDSQRFYGESTATYQRELEAVGVQGRNLRKAIASQWPQATCRNALELARRLMNVLQRKVEDVFVDQWKTPTPRERHGPVAMHLWEFASELAREHEPEVGRRLDEYERGRTTPTDGG